MTAPSPLGRLHRRVDAWLGAPEQNAAGRSGLFRVIFAVFYLWHLSDQQASTLSGLPSEHVRRLRLFEWLPSDPSPAAFELLESALVAALVLLMFGFCARFATAAVLGLGCALEAYHTRADAELAGVLLVFYLPLLMVLNGARWGDTYSVDALLRQRNGWAIEPSDSSGIYALPSRAALVVLSMLFLSAALLKVVGAGTWLDHPRFIANLVLDHNVKSAVYGLSLNPLAPSIAGSPLLYSLVRYQVPLFEGFFFLSLFGPKLRNFFLALALVFHSVGAIWLIVTFSPVLITYALFVDWEAARQRLWPKAGISTTRLPAWSGPVAALLVAVAAGALWNTELSLRAVLGIHGAVDWRSIWYPVLPLSLGWLIVASVDLLRSAVARARG
jgi:hypothetical protein